MSPSRRELITWLPAAMALVRCSRPEPEPDEPLVVLSVTEAGALEKYGDQVLPPDGGALGVARYVDRLLSSTGVFISSTGSTVPLDRVAKAAWDLRVAELKAQLLPVLAGGKSLAQLGSEERELVASLVTEAAFARPQYGGNQGQAGWELVGSLGAQLPIGFVSWDGEKNVERASAPVSTAEPGEDRHPLDQSTRDLLDEVTRATGGRTKP